jgi:hypothetical protein
MPTVQNSTTELQLIENLPSIGTISNTDLALIQTSVQSYKTTFQNLVANIPDNTTIEINPTTGKLRIKPSKFESLYPVGSIYMNASVSTDPAILLGFGTWEKFGEGRFPVGYKDGDSDFDTVEKTGGTKVPTMPAHTHNTPTGMLSGNLASGVSGYDGGAYYSPIGNVARTTTVASYGDALNGNLPPYITVYMWKRTT